MFSWRGAHTANGVCVNIHAYALLGGLPATPSVSENQGSVVIEYQNQYQIKLGQGDWVPYPR